MWQGIDIRNHFRPEKLRGYRIVENQEYNATYALVDTQEEHDLLETMIEESKPPKPADCLIDDYLLFTPFRYPPLKEATRFGAATERSPFYGSEKINAALAEKAYRLEKFDRDTSAVFPNRNLSFTSFKFIAAAGSCLNLLMPPFDAYHGNIHHPTSYQESHALSASMRKHKAQACIFQSVRDASARNFAIFEPSVFTKKSHDHTQWTCLIGKHDITFLDNRRRKTIFKRAA